jgi:actinorhodin biosynthesis protein ActVIA
MQATATFTETYVAVNQFYGRQVQLLDSGRFEEYARTFTPDGEFQHTPGVPPARGHDGIVAELRRFNTRFADDPVQRRHVFTMFNVVPRDDGDLDVTFYALVLTTRPGEKQPFVGPSCFVHDVLAVDDGQVRNRSRRVGHDHLFETH